MTAGRVAGAGLTIPVATNQTTATAMKRDHIAASKVYLTRGPGREPRASHRESARGMHTSRVMKRHWPRGARPRAESRGWPGHAETGGTLQTLVTACL